MQIGMLWYDNDPKKSMKDKITGALAYYKEKYGIAPTTVFVNPAMVKVENAKLDIPGVSIRTSRSVLYNHFWVGQDAAMPSRS